MNSIQSLSAPTLITTASPESSVNLNTEAVPGFVSILEQQILSNSTTPAPKSLSSAAEPAVLADTEAETGLIETDLNQQDLLSILLSMQTAPIIDNQTAAELNQNQSPVSQAQNPASLNQTNRLETLSASSKPLPSEPLLASSLPDSSMIQQTQFTTQPQSGPALNQISQPLHADNLISASAALITQETEDKTENTTLANSASFNRNQTKLLSSESPSKNQLIATEENRVNPQPNQQTLASYSAKPISDLTSEANWYTQTTQTDTAKQTITNLAATQDTSFKITAAAKQIASSIDQYNQLAIQPQQINLAANNASETRADIKIGQNPIIKSGSNSLSPQPTDLQLPESAPQMRSVSLSTVSELTKQTAANESQSEIMASKATEISFTDSNQSAAMTQMVAGDTKTNLPAVDFAASNNTSQATPSFPIETHINHPDWHKSVGDRLVWLVNNQQQTASLSLNPEHLGPIQIQVQIDNQQANVQFIANQAEVRQALQNAMPLLNTLFEQSGIQLGQSFVGTSDPGSQGQAFNQSKRANKPVETIENDPNLFSIAESENQGSNLIKVSV